MAVFLYKHIFEKSGVSYDVVCGAGGNRVLVLAAQIQQLIAELA